MYILDSILLGSCDVNKNDFHFMSYMNEWLDFASVFYLYSILVNRIHGCAIVFMIVREHHAKFFNGFDLYLDLSVTGILGHESCRSDRRNLVVNRVHDMGADIVSNQF